MHKLLQADKYLFSIINGKWHNSFFDWFMPYLRQSEIWIPLYLFLLVFVLMNVKKSGWFILLCICTVAITDLISSHIVKSNIIRIRPCGDPDLVGMVRFLVPYCPQSSSFTSSHAANHFGLASFISTSLRPVTGPVIYLFYLWAFIIVYAQVYVGVHFPLDIVGGSIIGLMTGMLLGNMYLKRSGNLILSNTRF
ncbi:MAG TPA: phosphatase PAP2 family protein [Flavisolibacter sp.]|jgi:undecaprenyl-diphosphatase|nr:phosphatase PAP2 family protein [Flavisolibacter sp.]